MGHVTTVICSHSSYMIGKLPIASKHWELTGNRQLPCWEHALSAVSSLHWAAYMQPLGMMAHMSRGCICAFSWSEEVIYKFKLKEMVNGQVHLKKKNILL